MKFYFRRCFYLQMFHLFKNFILGSAGTSTYRYLPTVPTIPLPCIERYFASIFIPTSECLFIPSLSITLSQRLHLFPCTTIFREKKNGDFEAEPVPHSGPLRRRQSLQGRVFLQLRSAGELAEPLFLSGSWIQI